MGILSHVQAELSKYKNGETSCACNVLQNEGVCVILMRFTVTERVDGSLTGCTMLAKCRRYVAKLFVLYDC